MTESELRYILTHVYKHPWCSVREDEIVVYCEDVNTIYLLTNITEYLPFYLDNKKIVVK